MDVTYDYSIDDVINYGITDNQSMIDAILKETLPLLPIRMKAPQFGCSAFGTVLDRHIVMGRNYDFKRDTSAMPACWNMTRSRRAARCAGRRCRPSRIFTAAMPT